MEIHEKQRKILNRLAEAAARGVSPPTILEFVEFLGVKSPAVVQYHLRKLQEAQLIHKTPGKSRSVTLTNLGKSEVTHRPIPVLGDIAAGLPILAQESKNAADLVRDLTGRGDFALRVKGDSMQDADILDGDYAILRTQQTADQGEIVAVLIRDFDTEATLKGYYPESDRVRFVAANDDYDDIVIDRDGADWEILGKYVGKLRYDDGYMPEAYRV